MADGDLSQLTMTEKTATALLKRTIDDDRYPLSPRIGVLRGILAKLQPPKPAPAPLPPPRQYSPPRGSARQRWARGGIMEGPPATLGSTAAAVARLIVWCRACGHQVEPDAGEQAQRTASALPLLPSRSSASRSIEL
jgi:hypothetical protein